jgi:hypothetical protein
VGIIVSVVVGFEDVGRDVERMPVKGAVVGIFVGVFEEGEEGEVVGELVVLDAEGMEKRWELQS